MDNLYYTYLRDISKYNLLKREEELSLIYQAQNGNQKAFDRLVVSNQKFVVSVAKKYTNQGLDLMDLISLGNIGLIESIKKFDPTTGNKLITYSVWWIKQKIKEGIGNESRLIRLPLNRMSEISDIIKEFQNQPLGTSYLCTLKKACLANNLSEAELINRINIYYLYSSKFKDAIVISPDRLIAEDFLEERLKIDTKIILKNKIDQLKDRQVYIATNYFDLFGNSRTLESIGEELDLTRERVRQIKVQIIKKLNGLIDKSDFNDTENIPYSIINMKEKSYRNELSVLYELSDFVNKEYQVVEELIDEGVDDKVDNDLEDDILMELYENL